MLFAGFRQLLSGVCKSLASLTLWPSAPSPVKTPSFHPHRTNRVRIGSFKFQSLGSQRKQYDTLPQDLRRYHIDILGLQETKIYKLDRKLIGDYTLLTLPATQALHGVGFALSPRLLPYLSRYWAHSDRIGVLQLRLPQTGRVNVITAYLPHSGRPHHEVGSFYADFHEALGRLPRRDVIIITGDFNAKLGWRATGEDFLGSHARGIRNRNGHALASFSETNNLFATNTAFPKRANHKTTWSQHRTNHCIYNQIDYILCQQSCRRLCMDAQSWGGTITSSDHKLVTADFILKAAYRLRFHTRPRTPPAQKLARDRLLHNDDSRTEYMEALFRTLTTD